MPASTVDRSSSRPKHKKQVVPETTVIHAEVVGSERFRPHLQRITLHSEEFAGWITTVPDQFITFIFPRKNRKQPAVERDFTWDQWNLMPVDEQPAASNYTVRFWYPDRNEVVVDMVLHEGSSAGCDWARASEPGDKLAIWGPRVAFDPPADTEWLLLFGDDTALPGIGVILETLPANQRAVVVVEVDSEADQVPFPVDDRIDVQWLYRNGSNPAASKQLVESVQALSIPEAPGYAWGGGEVRIMNAIGKYLRRTVGFRPTDVCAVGYWHAEAH